MKVVLENVVPTQQGKRGIGNYFQNLATAISRQDSVNEYVLFNYFFKDFSAKRREVLSIPQQNFSNCIRRCPQRVVEYLEWELGVPVINALLPGGAQLYHAVESRLPRLSGRIRTVVTIHDLFIELFPHWHLEPPTKLRDACRRADRLIAVSECTKKDLMERYEVPEDKIAMIYYAIDHATFHVIRDPQRLSEVRARLRLPERFLLSTGPFELRRNMERLLEAFASVLETAAGKDLFLVLTGGPNHYSDRIHRKIRELGLQDRVSLPGHIAHEDLAALYQLAEIFIYPSLYEGFGLPPGEALACGAAVITSNISAVPEVVGDAALLVDPHDLEELTSAIRLLLEDKGRRDELRAKGPARSRLFTWEEAARKTRAVYEEAMSL